MPTARRLVLVIAFVALAAPVTACTLASPTHITVQPGDETEADASTTMSTSAPTGGAAATCGTDDFIVPDLSKLTACGDGKGHCFDKTKAPMAEELTACPDASEVCVPDEILEAGGKPLKNCTFVMGGPGGCVTLNLLPKAKEQGGSVLKQDVCEAHQRCLPCADPTKGNAPTPFCQPIGVHENACAAGSGTDAGAAPAAQPCCTTNGKSNGICLAETIIPEGQRDKTKQDTCAPTDRCVPAAFVAGAPVKCGGGGLLGPGVCMDRCFNGMMSLAGDIGILKTEGCGETEVCVPCRFLKGQNAPGCE